MTDKIDDEIFILNYKSLKLGDRYTYISSNISSTESDVYMCKEMAWTVIE